MLIFYNKQLKIPLLSVEIVCLKLNSCSFPFVPARETAKSSFSLRAFGRHRCQRLDETNFCLTACTLLFGGIFNVMYVVLAYSFLYTKASTEHTFFENLVFPLFP